MAFAAELNADAAFGKVAVLQGEASGRMVGSHHDERMAVGRCPFEHVADRPVEVEQLFHRLGDVVAVEPVVDAGSFDHHHEAVGIGAEQLESAGNGAAEKIAALLGYGQVVRGEDANHGQPGAHQRGLIEGYVVARGGHLLRYVTPVRALGGEPVEAAAAQVVDSALDIVRDQVFLVIAVDVVAAEVTRRRVCEMAGHGDSGLLAEFARTYQHARQIRAVRRGPDVALGGLPTGRERGPAGAGIGDQPIRAPGARKSHYGEVVKIQFTLVEDPAAADLLEAHSVADEDDDVADIRVLSGLSDLYYIIGAVCLIVLQRLVLLAGDNQNCQGGKKEKSFSHYLRSSGLRPVNLTLKIEGLLSSSSPM